MYLRSLEEEKNRRLESRMPSLLHLNEYDGADSVASLPGVLEFASVSKEEDEEPPFRVGVFKGKELYTVDEGEWETLVEEKEVDCAYLALGQSHEPHHSLESTDDEHLPPLPQSKKTNCQIF